MTGRRLVTPAVLLCALVAGCGGAQHRQPHPRATATPATDAQVLMLARMLESDFAHRGAKFTASLQVNGQPVQATGRVDFVSGRGAALVRPRQR